MKNLRKILWVSRHDPTKSQLEKLADMYGDISITKMDGFKSAEEICRRYYGENFTDIVVVAPLSVIQKLTEYGIRPLWAEMEVTTKDKAETSANGRFYRFRRFRRIKEIKIVYEDV